MPARCLVLLALLLAAGVCAQQPGSRDPADVEARLDELRREIAGMQQQIDRDLTQRDALLDELAQAERSVSRARRARLETDAELGRVRAEIEGLERRRIELDTQIEQHAGDLGRLLAAAYRLGGQSRLKVLLDQDEPGRLARRLAYHSYLSRGRIRAMERLNSALAELAAAREELDQQATALEALLAQRQAETRALEAALGERETAVAAVDERLAGRRDRLEALERDEARLSELLEQLSRALADVPPELEVPPFAELRGRLPMPADGPVRAAFGDRRSGELERRGWLIGVDTGAEVRSVAHGRVAYADWLRGYGLLLIIDHGDGYMSLYAHNEALMRDVGDWVATGETVAVSGRSGGLGEPALYFELRSGGKPIDPAGWIAR